MEFLQIYWPVIAVALIIGIIVGYLYFRPKQNVRLSDSVPLRPHMTHSSTKPSEGRNIADEAAAAASDIAGHLLRTNVHHELPGASGPPDDLLRLKGVGPKLAAMLNERGHHPFRSNHQTILGPGRNDRCVAWRVPGPLRARPDTGAGRLSRPRRHRRIRKQVREALNDQGEGVSLSASCSVLRRLGRLTSSLSIFRPSMSTTSNRKPSNLKTSPVSGMRFRTDRAKPATVE